MEKGQIVRSEAGRDAGSLLVVLSVKEPYLLLADGKKRPLANPKQKKIMHVHKTNTVLNLESLNTDKKIRKALRAISSEN